MEGGQTWRKGCMVELIASATTPFFGKEGMDVAEAAEQVEPRRGQMRPQSGQMKPIVVK